VPDAEDRERDGGGHDRHPPDLPEPDQEARGKQHLLRRPHEDQDDEVLLVEERRERDRDQTDHDPDHRDDGERHPHPGTAFH
jgi:hypothetical protein